MALLFLPAGFIAGAFALAQDRDMIRVCRHARADAGASVAIDHEVLAREYARVAREIDKDVQASMEKLPALLERQVDAGLPSCRFNGSKSQKLSAPLAREVRGRQFLFASSDEASRRGRRHPDATLLITSARSIAVAGDIAKELKRPVALATRELAASLGVECAPCLVTINAEGDRLELVYGE